MKEKLSISCKARQNNQNAIKQNQQSLDALPQIKCTCAKLFLYQLDLLLKACENWLVYLFVYDLVFSGFLTFKNRSNSAAEKEIASSASISYCNILNELIEFIAIQISYHYFVL